MDIPSLDGIRAASFLLVFVSHAGLGSVIPGGFGVTVFFFLSGYLITTLLRMERERTGRVSLRDFYVRRAFRILPPFYAALALGAALTWAGAVRGELTLPGLAAQALHAANYWMISGGAGMPVGSGVYWSLAVEEHFYLLFPLLFLILSRTTADRRSQAFALLGLCAAATAWRCALVYGWGTAAGWADRTYMGSDTRADSLLFGCALALWGNPALDRDAHRWTRSAAAAVAVLAAAGAMLMFTFVCRDAGFRETLRYTLQGVALVPLFVAAIRLHDRPAFAWLNWGWVRRLGVLSYGLYLLHYTALHVAWDNTGAGRVVDAALALAATVLAAEALHRLVERPAAAMRSRFLKAGKSERSAQTADGREAAPVAPAERPRPLRPRRPWSAGDAPCGGSA
jgi:peptidoglycan/LPS O-acetylase OafA/YrhL